MLSGSDQVDGRKCGDMHSYGMRPQVLYSDTDELDNWRLISEPVPIELLQELGEVVTAARAEIQDLENRAAAERSERREAWARIEGEMAELKRLSLAARTRIEYLEEEVRVLKSARPTLPLPAPTPAPGADFPEPAGMTDHGTSASPLESLGKARKRANG